MAVSATIAAVGAGTAAYQGERQRKAEVKQERLQENAQMQAAVMAGREMEEARNIKNKQNRKPFVQDAEQMTNKSGTMLAGGGAASNQLKTSSMLGGY